MQSVIEENAVRELRGAGDERAVTTILTLDQANYVFGRPPGAHERGFSDCERELEELRRQFQERVFAAAGHARGQELLRRLAYSVK